MIKLTANDFQPLSEFPLRWRWTDPQRKVLPAAVLAQMRPLTAAKAQELWQWLSVSTQELYYALFPLWFKENYSLCSVQSRLLEQR